MRTIKLLALFGLVLVVSGTAGATVTLPPPNTPLIFQISSLDAGTVYLPPAPGVYGVGGGGPLPAGIPGLNSMPGESSWGIFQVNTISTSSVLVPNDSIGIVGAPVWTSTATDKLVGIFWGEVDQTLVVAADGSQTAKGAGLKIAIFEQTTSPNLGTALPSGRAGAAWYTGIGDTATSTLWFTGVSSPGFLTAPPNPAAEFQSTFNPSSGIGATGDAKIWVDAAPVDLTSILPMAYGAAAVGSVNGVLNTNWFINGAATADVRLQITTTSLNPTNSPVNGKFTVSDSDPVTAITVIPEPVTMFSAFMAISSLGMYIRRRMKVQAA